MEPDQCCQIQGAKFYSFRTWETNCTLVFFRQGYACFLAIKKSQREYPIHPIDFSCVFMK
ncbi:MAG: hypothetical protein B6245_05670 [Desulfobacteraceae bacterium 4572_88]|nr:MAG: hypothetical protein B6245_05670 [Desulfobacteraceae bacterium 4572_88]